MTSWKNPINWEEKVEKKWVEPRLRLPNMPRLVKECIIDCLHTEEKFSLRKCSYQFKYLVDASKIRIYRLSLQLCDNYVFMIRNTGNAPSYLTFRPQDVGDSVKAHDFKIFQCDHIYESGNYIDKAIEKFVSVLRNPAVYVDSMVFDFWTQSDNQERSDEFYSKVTSALKSLNREIAVKRIHIEMTGKPNTEYLRNVLTCLKPKFLESFAVSKYRTTFSRSEIIDFSEIQKTEQWKKLENLTVNGFDLELSFEETKHISKMNCSLNELDLEFVNRTIDKILENDGLNSRRLEFKSIHRSAFLDYFSRFERIPSSPDFTEFRITRNNVNVRIILGPIFIVLSEGY